VEEQLSDSVEDEVPIVEDEEEEEESSPIYDVDKLEHDPGLRVPISHFGVNDHDTARRGYIL